MKAQAKFVVPSVDNFAGVFNVLIVITKSEFHSIYRTSWCEVQRKHPKPEEARAEVTCRIAPRSQCDPSFADRFPELLGVSSEPEDVGVES